MKVIEHLEKAKGKTMVSFEVLPPLKGIGMNGIFKCLNPLMEFEPPFIDVTYHREEYIYNQRPSGYYEKTAIRKRPGTVGICAAIMHHYGVDPIPHLICGGFNREDTENALIDLSFLGIDNVLALRGDGRKFDGKFIPEEDGHPYAINLVEQIQDMNKGQYLDSKIENGNPTDFCVGIAGYPEKHFEAPNFEMDLYYLKKKIEAGADYIVTQMFFDNQKYFEFVDKCRAEGITIPIIPGLKVLTRKSQLTAVPRTFFIDLPDDMVNSISKCDTKEKVVEAGIEWSIAQCKELKEAGVPCLHFYTMGSPDPIHKVISQTL